jgi:hypothetical protein
VFENRVLRRIFGPKRDEVTGGLRKLHNEELHNLYSLPSIIRLIKSRRMRWEGHVAHMGRRGRHIGKRPLGRPRRKWVGNFKTGLYLARIKFFDPALNHSYADFFSTYRFLLKILFIHGDSSVVPDIRLPPTTIVLCSLNLSTHVRTFLWLKQVALF